MCTPFVLLFKKLFNCIFKDPCHVLGDGKPYGKISILCQVFSIIYPSASHITSLKLITFDGKHLKSSLYKCFDNVPAVKHH